MHEAGQPDKVRASPSVSAGSTTPHTCFMTGGPSKWGALAPPADPTTAGPQRPTITPEHRDSPNSPGRIDRLGHRYAPGEDTLFRRVFEVPAHAEDLRDRMWHGS